MLVISRIARLHSILSVKFEMPLLCIEMVSNILSGLLKNSGKFGLFDFLRIAALHDTLCIWHVRRSHTLGFFSLPVRFLLVICLFLIVCHLNTPMQTWYGFVWVVLRVFNGSIHFREGCSAGTTYGRPIATEAESNQPLSDPHSYDSGPPCWDVVYGKSVRVSDSPCGLRRACYRVTQCRLHTVGSAAGTGQNCDLWLPGKLTWMLYCSDDFGYDRVVVMSLAMTG